MKTGTEDKKKLIIAGVSGFFALLSLFYLYNVLFGGTSTPAPAPAVIVNSATVKTTPGPSRTVTAPPGFAVAEKVGTTSGQLDPTLHMQAMRVTESLVYTGSGRNIFAGVGGAATDVDKPKAPARPPLPVAVAPPRPVDLGPPPPPPINLKFFGTSTQTGGIRKAFLLAGDEVFLASPGDVVQRRYRVVTIGPSSIVVEDLPNNNKQTLPLIPN